MASRNSFPRHSPRPTAIAGLQVVDTCADRECLEDLQVFFSPSDQNIINRCVQVRCPAATVENVAFGLEPTPWRRGCFTVETLFMFRVRLEAVLPGQEPPVCVEGSCFFERRSTLFGGENCVRTFRSNGAGCGGVPEASIQCAQPVVLNVHLTDGPVAFGAPPQAVIDRLGGRLSPEPHRAVLISLGLFSVLSLERPTQLAVSSFGPALPTRECRGELCGKEVCDLFNAMPFPIEQFNPCR